MSAVVASEHFQGPERFIAGLTPELSGTFEPTLQLSAGGFDRAAADRFSGASPGAIVPARLMFAQVMDFLGHRGGGLGLCLEVAEVLIAGGQEMLVGALQRAARSGRQNRQGFGRGAQS